MKFNPEWIAADGRFAFSECADDVEGALTVAEYDALFSGQSSGLLIVRGAGGRPELAVRVLSPEEQRAAIDAAVTDWIDGQAVAAGFKNAAYITSYYNSTNSTWRAAAQAFVPWRDGIWAACIDVAAAVEAGTRTAPTAEELIAELTPFSVA